MCFIRTMNLQIGFLNFRQRCLDDINASFMFGYPPELVFKLFERRGRCYVKLNRFDEAAKAFEAALLKVEDSKLEGKKRDTFISEAKKKLAEVKPKINEGKMHLHSTRIFLKSKFQLS